MKTVLNSGTLLLDISPRPLRIGVPRNTGTLIPKPVASRKIRDEWSLELVRELMGLRSNEVILYQYKFYVTPQCRLEITRIKL